MSLVAQPVRGLTVDASIGYADARFVKPVFVAQSATSGPTNIRAGNALFQAATPWQVTVAARYDFNVGDRPAFVRTQYEFSSRNFRLGSGLDPQNASFNPTLGDVPATGFVRARAGMTFGRLEAQVFVDNLFNVQPGLEAFNYGGRSPFITNYSFRPRTAGLTLLYRDR